MGRMFSFYSLLPKSLPGFYIKGYSESLAYMKGVRVIPDQSFVESVPREFRYFFEFTDPRSGNQLTYPAYYVPIKVGTSHYGFVLKSPNIKPTPGESWWKGFKVVNLDALYDPRPFVVLVEGIKDAYLFLRAGFPTVVMTTASVTHDFLEECLRLGKTVYFAGDNDEAGHKNFNTEKPESVVNMCKKLGLRIFPAFPILFKDWGYLFDTHDRQEIQDHLKDFTRVYNEIMENQK